MYFFYRILTAAGMFLLAPYFALRGWRAGEPSRALRERLGSLPPEIAARATAATGTGPVWIHAVSVGEVLAARPLIDGLKRRFPGAAIFVSTTTETGQRLARERLQNADGIFYFPLDWVVPVRRALRAIRPSLVIIMETEIWPNFLREARRANIPVVFANARISEKSFARFKRWEFLIGPFFQRTMQDAELFLAQSPEDSARLLAMGAEQDRIDGHRKSEVRRRAARDLPASVPGSSSRFASRNAGPCWSPAALSLEKKKHVLAAYDLVQRQWRRTLLILAPRKPAQFDAAAAITAEGGWKVVRRSDLDLTATSTKLLTCCCSIPSASWRACTRLPTLPSSAARSFPRAATIFWSRPGSRVRQSSARPWRIFTRWPSNFSTRTPEFKSPQVKVSAKSGFSSFEDNAMRQRMGTAAREISERNRGATERSLDRIAAVWNQSAKAAERMTLQRSLLWPFSLLYGAAAHLRARAYRRGIFKPQHLDGVVISVGNLTTGGTGKTPMVLWIAERLMHEGKKVGILTRGYRGEKVTPSSGIDAQAATTNAAISTSDEVRLLQARLGDRVPLGVGANRYEQGRELAKLGVNWFVLDDGFQHLQLARDVDIVLIDATNPFGGGRLLPAGHLREPRSALARADIIVITRSTHAPAIEAAIRRDSAAPIFYARPKLDSIHSITDGQLAERGRTRCATETLCLLRHRQPRRLSQRPAHLGFEYRRPKDLSRPSPLQ